MDANNDIMQCVHMQSETKSYEFIDLISSCFLK